MRAIKFRVWYNNRFWKTDFLISPLGKIHAVSRWDFEDKCHTFNIDFFNLKGEYILQQFTGLSDKNNKEIYEGDIIKQLYYEYPDQPREKLIDEFIGEVVWDHYFTRFALARPELEDCCEFKTIRTGNVKLEVIGNMMENPELL